MNDDPLIGRRLANYQIEGFLGQGGMAQVYYGHDVNLHRPVAVKVIDARYRGDPGYAKRFVSEAQVDERGHYWRVRVGPFESRREADEYRRRFETEERMNTYVVRRERDS